MAMSPEMPSRAPQSAPKKSRKKLYFGVLIAVAAVIVIAGVADGLFVFITITNLVPKWMRQGNYVQYEINEFISIPIPSEVLSPYGGYEYIYPSPKSMNLSVPTRFEILGFNSKDETIIIKGDWRFIQNTPTQHEISLLEVNPYLETIHYTDRTYIDGRLMSGGRNILQRCSLWLTEDDFHLEGFGSAGTIIEDEFYDAKNGTIVINDHTFTVWILYYSELSYGQARYYDTQTGLLLRCETRYGGLPTPPYPPRPKTFYTLEIVDTNCFAW